MSAPTPDQQRAIDATGDTLVVAGAGAGKTRTLVDRALALTLRRESPIPIDRLLMVTFTEAAAAEMRGRIRERMEEQLIRTADAAVEKQLALLESAPIGTLHGFCLQLIRERFHELKLDPLVIVMDEADSRLLAAETLDDLLDRRYAGRTPDAEEVRSLIQDLARGDDRPIRSLILELHAHAQSLPDPDAWLQSQRRAFECESADRWLSLLAEGFTEWRAHWEEVLEQHCDENPNAAQCLAALHESGDAPAREAIAVATARILEIDLEWPARKKTRLREPIKKIFDEAKFLQSVAGSADALNEDWDWSRRRMAALVDLARDFESSFSRAKREQAAVDFSDLEQFALRLLWDNENDRPTATAQEWRERIDAVFVDEYQDINAAQDRIIRALSREGAEANRFLVGDVKQSIYRFRQANPRIFQRRSDDWRQADAEGQTLPLADNFRSHEGILNFVNGLFAGLMRREIGGVAFGDDSRIRFGAAEKRPHFAAGAESPPRVELCVQITGGGESEESDNDDSEAGREIADLSRMEKEARLVGQRLRDLHDTGFNVWDDSLGEFRAARWNDMVVLLRSPGAKAESYAKEFARLGIPIEAARGGFYEAGEVSDFLSLLMILDNPLQDIPLLAVLRSPLVGLSLNELASIRLTRRKGSLWSALRQFHRLEGASFAGSDADHVPESSDRSAGHRLVLDDESRPGRAMPGAPNSAKEPGKALRSAARSMKPKVARFMDAYARWRRLAREGSLSLCLEAALDETHYEDWLLAHDRGEQRSANLNRFLAQARRFDQFQRQGLFRFLRHVEAQREHDVEPDPAGADPGNAVRLISVHRSKGLEFPIVALAELGSPFNLADLRGAIVLDDDLGLCPRVLPPGGHRGYPSLPYWLAVRRQRAEVLGEEMRLLYVATTRAKDLLILGGSASRKTIEEKWSRDPASFPTTSELLKANRFLDWLGPAGGALTGDPDWNQRSTGEGALMSWRFVAGDELSLTDCDKQEPETVQSETSAACAPDELEALVQRIEWRYPHAAAAREAAKASVTAIRRRMNEEPDDDALPLFRFPVWTMARDAADSIAVAHSAKLSAAEIGNAHHAFQQHVAIDQTAAEDNLRAEAERMTETGLLTQEEADALNFDALSNFWTSGLGAGIRDQADLVRRELPFTARFNRSEISSAGIEPDTEFETDDFVVVQGAVDLAILGDDGIEIIDFKTDRMREQELPAKRKIYEPQIRLYAAAMERIYRKPVTRAALYFLALGRTVDVIEPREERPAGPDPRQLELSLRIG